MELLSHRWGYGNDANFYNGINMALNPSTGWGYYKQLDFVDKSGSSANYQIKMRLYSGNSSSDFPGSGLINMVDLNNYCNDFPNDIRFGTTNDQSTATQLAQWCEVSGGGANNLEWVDYWVKMPNDGSNTFYLFAENTSASSYSSGAATFIFFDDFDHLNDWDTTNADGRFSATNSILTITNTTNYNTWAYITKDLGATYSSMAIARCRCTDDGNTALHTFALKAGMDMSSYDTGPSSSTLTAFYDDEKSYWAGLCDNSDTLNYTKYLPYTLNTWYKWYGRYPYSSSCYADGSIGTDNLGNAVGQADASNFANPRYVYFSVRKHSNQEVQTTEWDWIAVGKYEHPAIPSGDTFGSWTSITPIAAVIQYNDIYISTVQYGNELAV